MTKTAVPTSPEEPENRKPRKSRSRGRANGEGSIFPYRNGYAAYVWVTTPEGKRTGKWAYGKTREEVHEKWLKLHSAAKQGPVVTKSPKLADYLAYWLREVVNPNLAPATVANYDMFVRLYVVPELGQKRLDKLTVRDVRTWLNQLRERCQCCAQGKDERRNDQRCCTIGECCEQIASERTVRDAWTVLRAALNKRRPRGTHPSQRRGAHPRPETSAAQGQAVVGRRGPQVPGVGP